MAKGFICDMTGANAAGEPVHKVEIEGEKFKAEIHVFVRKDKTTFIQADLGPDAVAKIKKAAAGVIDGK